VQNPAAYRSDLASMLNHLASLYRDIGRDSDAKALEAEAQGRAEKDGSISFEVVSNGMTGEEWIKHLEANGVVIGDWAKAVLRSAAFKPTNGVRYQVRILKWDECSGCARVQDIIKEAENRKLSIAPVELGCLIRDMFPDGEIEKMGLTWIVVAQDKFPTSLGAGVGKSLLSAYFDNPGFSINYRGEGFAFTLQ
jgi:hypothetical protein